MLRRLRIELRKSGARVRLRAAGRLRGHGDTRAEPARAMPHGSRIGEDGAGLLQLRAARGEAGGGLAEPALDVVARGDRRAQAHVGGGGGGGELGRIPLEGGRLGAGGLRGLGKRAEWVCQDKD